MKNKLKMQNKILFGFVGLLSVVLIAKSAVAAGSGSFLELLADRITEKLLGGQEQNFGGSYTSEPTNLTRSDDWQAVNSLFEYGDFEVDGTSYFDGASVFSGAMTGTSLALSGALNNLESTETITASNTITLAESGKTFYLSGATSTQTLPATSTAAGAVYKFVVAGSVTGDITIVTNGSGNEIEGTLIVAGAVVDCDAEDTITIVSDGENVGDFVELRSNGSKWFIGASGALTASKMTCTAT